MIEFIILVVAVTLLFCGAAGKLITNGETSRIVQGVLLLVAAIIILVRAYGV